jgi:hypothetical protein
MIANNLINQRKVESSQKNIGQATVISNSMTSIHLKILMLQLKKHRLRRQLKEFLIGINLIGLVTTIALQEIYYQYLLF